MLRTKLRNIANRTKRDEDVRKYKKQRNCVSKLNERAKRQFYRDLDPVKTGKDKQFSKTFKPIFAGKSTNVSDKIVLIENGSIISNDEDIAHIFNSYFVNITDTLPIEKPMLPSDCRMSDPVLQLKYDLPRAEQWYNHKPEGVTENESIKVLWDFNIITDYEIEHR